MTWVKENSEKVEEEDESSFTSILLFRSSAFLPFQIDIDNALLRFLCQDVLKLEKILSPLFKHTIFNCTKIRSLFKKTLTFYSVLPLIRK